MDFFQRIRTERLTMCRGLAHRTRIFAATLATVATSFGQVAAQDRSLGKLFTALDRPVIFETGIDRMPLERALVILGQKHQLEFVLDVDAFARQQNRKDIAKSNVLFDKVSGIPVSLFLDLLLRQIDAHFETKEGKVVIVPRMKRHALYHPPCLPTQEERRRRLVEAKFRHPVTLDKGLEPMTFGEAKQYFEDRFDLNILVDQGLFPKSKGNLMEHEVALPAMKGEPLEQVLTMLAQQLHAVLEIRGGAVLLVPKGVDN
jgi:hypothetical protein